MKKLMINGSLFTLILLHDSIFRLRDNSRIPKSAEIESGKKYKKCREDETVLSPFTSFDCEFERGGVLESYRMTDEEASSGMGKTEASSILVAMHHGMWMVEGQASGIEKDKA